MSRISFALLCILVVCLAVATFIEAESGTRYVNESVYGSCWFVGLWFMAAVSALAMLIRRKIYRNTPLFLLHLSFVVILAGAFLTFVTGVRGELHLREGEVTDMFTVSDSNSCYPLPFSVSLERFETLFYPGSDAPADYVSRLRIMTDGKTCHETVSMNNIVSLKGVRLYQTSYDTDGKGTLLSVNRDPWGIPVTYGGYILFGISMLWLLCSPGGGFRKLLRHPLLKGGIGLGIILFPGGISAHPRTIDNECAGKLGDIVIMYNGRMAPLQTMAYDLTLKLTGAKSYRGYSPEQVVAGWIFFPDEWSHEPMIRVKDPKLRDILHIGEYAPLTAFFDEKGEYLLGKSGGVLHDVAMEPSLLRAIAETDEKVQIIRMLQQGDILTIFPHKESNHLRWYSPLDELPEEMDEMEVMLIRNLFFLLKRDISDGDDKDFVRTVDKFRIYQKKKAGIELLSENKIRCEKLFNRIGLTGILYKVNLGCGVLLLVLFGLVLIMADNARLKTIASYAMRVAVVMLWCVCSALTLYIGLRAYVSGRMPLGNGYEIMIFIAWVILLIAALFNRKFRLLIPFGFLLSGFALLVSDLGQLNSQITPLMPVLASPWLSMHVSVIMVAYALFAFMMLNGLTAIFLHVAGKGGDDIGMKLMLVSRIFLYPAVFFLGTGIFIGAVWANVSWGRYWAWDPKEVWALICFLLYGLAFHSQSIPLFRRPLFFHVFMVLAFLSLLMTCFGVNWLLGGMHSYG